jgi:hypothetical protein
VDAKSYDGQLVNPPAKLLSQFKHYVCIRVTDLTKVDVGHFDFDTQSTVYGFIMNADEQVYMRYGGRDDRGSLAHNNVKSLILALEKGREIHAKDVAGEWKALKRAAAKFPRDLPDVKNNQIKKGNCVHCHNIGHAEVKQKQSAGTFDKKTDPWVYPDIFNFGVELDENKLLYVKKVSDAAKKAGMKSKDVIIKCGSHDVLTYADLQQRLHEMPFNSKELKLTVMRKDEEAVVVIPLGEHWRATGINRRASTHAIEPFPGFWCKELSKSEKRKYGVKADRLAGLVTKFWVPQNPQPAFKAGLREGDVVIAVNGEKECAYTNHPGVYIRLNFKTGDEITITVLRAGKKTTMKYTVKAKPW